MIPAHNSPVKPMYRAVFEVEDDLRNVFVKAIEKGLKIQEIKRASNGSIVTLYAPNMETLKKEIEAFENEFKNSRILQIEEVVEPYTNMESIIEKKIQDAVKDTVEEISKNTYKETLRKMIPEVRKLRNSEVPDPEVLESLIELIKDYNFRALKLKKELSVRGEYNGVKFNIKIPYKYINSFSEIELILAFPFPEEIKEMIHELMERGLVKEGDKIRGTTTVDFMTVIITGTVNNEKKFKYADLDGRIEVEELDEEE